MTTGPWRPIFLHTYKSRITDLRVRADVSESLDTVINVSLAFSSSGGAASIALKDHAGKVVKQADARLEDGKAQVEFRGAKGEFDLWYPVGYGKQPIYTVEVRVADEVCMTWGPDERGDTLTYLTERECPRL